MSKVFEDTSQKRNFFKSSNGHTLSFIVISLSYKGGKNFTVICPLKERLRLRGTKSTSS